MLLAKIQGTAAPLEAAISSLKASLAPAPRAAATARPQPVQTGATSARRTPRPLPLTFCP